MIRFTGHGVITEKPRVGQLGHFFRAPCRKNYALDRKMSPTFFNGLDELYHHAKFVEIEQRVPAVDAKIWCLYVFFCLPRSGLPARCSFEGEHSLNKYCVRFYRSILILCSPFFSEGIALSQELNNSHFCRWWRHNFREIAVENCEKSKNRRKSLCAQLRIDS